MQPADYGLLLLGSFAGGLVSGLAGFGTGLMALGIWLHVLPPSTAVPLVIICSIAGQSTTLPSMWRSFDLSLVWPFLIGGLAGVPVGTALVPHADPALFKIGTGVVLLIFPMALMLNRSPVAIRFGGKYADGAVGFAGGVLGGLTGMSGVPPTLWATVRGWNKGERRGVFQIFNWTVLVLSLCLQFAGGLVKPELGWLAAVTLPGTFAGAWIGAKIYHAMSDRNFGNVVLVLLFTSGVGLIWSSIGGR
jgi:uncharacterized protein